MIGKALLVAFAAAAAAGAGSSKAKLHQLNSREVASALAGKLASYSPPGWADAGVHEEYHIGGMWRGIRYGRGPVSFSGRWKIENGQLCVRAESGLAGAPWERGWVCRKVWRDHVSGKLLMAHMSFGIDPKRGLGPLELLVRQLPKER